MHCLRCLQKFDFVQLQSQPVFCLPVASALPWEKMVERSVPVACVSLGVALLAVGLVFLFAQLGGLLNRGRGGYVNFGDLAYWPAHILSRLLFAVPTGLIVLVFGAHARAALIVTLLTWFSLYVGWGVYFNIGVDDPGNWATRAGVFDWLLGRQERNWHFDHRFAREYAGMSLRGLVWTAPQGYALQQLGFGWEYSLCGSLMGFVYYLGKRTPEPEHDKDFNRVFGAGTAYAEWYWGVWIWFVLLIACLSQSVRRVHKWIYKHNQYQYDFRPYSAWETIKYVSLNRPAIRGIYEFLMIVINILFCCSVAYYSLITQSDLCNKGQTFFGLFTGVLFMTFVQGLVWSNIYQKLQNYRNMKRSRRHAARQYVGTPRMGRGRGGADLEHLETVGSPTGAQNGETQPLLAPSWPYGNGDGSSPRPAERQRTLNLPEGNPAHQHQREDHAGAQIQLRVAPANTTTALLILWQSVEKWMMVDVFVWTRRFVGIVSIFGTIVTIFMTIVATVWGWDNPRFLYWSSLNNATNASNTTLFL